MGHFTRWIVRRRWIVLGLWLVIVAISGWAATRLPSLLTNHISLPGTESERAEELLESRFGQRSVGSYVLVAVTTANSASIEIPVAIAAQRAAAQLRTGKILGTERLNDRIVIAHIASSLESAEAKLRVPAMREAVGKIPATATYLTGVAAFEHDLDPILLDDLRKGELLVAIPIATALLVVTFGTLAFLLPLVFAVCTIAASLGIVYLIAHAMELNAYVTNLISLVGLGIAVDYSLLVVCRFREELAAGAVPEEAIVRTMDTAGRAVVFSGTAVAIGLALLIFLPLPFLRGFGVGGAMSL